MTLAPPATAAGATARADAGQATPGADRRVTGAHAQLPHTAFEAVVLAVIDGDTLDVRDHAGRRFRIRIAGIDAPERAQPFSNASRRHLRELVDGIAVRVEPGKLDPFGRLVADLRVDDLDVGLAQVASGYAWHFRRYEREQSPAQRRAYRDAETRARAARAGLWQEAQPEPPWEFRRRARSR